MEKSKSFNFAVLTYFIIVVCFVALRLISSFGLLKFMGGAGDFVFTVVVQIGLLFCGSVFLFSAFKKQKPQRAFSQFGVKKVSWKVVWLSVLLGAVVFFINTFVSATFNGLIELFGYEHAHGEVIESYSFGSLILNLIFTALLPGICEEIAHRGMLLRSFSPLGPWKAILISSLLFGLLHLNVEQFFYATIIGIFLGVLTMMSNSIVPAMIVHFMNNALSTYMLFSRVNGLPLGKMVTWIDTVISSNIFLGIILSILLLCALCYLAVFLTRKIFQHRFKEDIEIVQKEFNRQLLRQNYLIDVEKAKLGPDADEVAENALLAKLKEFILADGLIEEEKFKPSSYSKALLYTTLALGSVITIFTFVWGVL